MNFQPIEINDQIKKELRYAEKLLPSERIADFPRLIADSDKQLDTPTEAFRQSAEEALRSIKLTLKARGATWSLLATQAVKERFLTKDELDLATQFVTGSAVPSDFEVGDLSDSGWNFIKAFLSDFDKMSFLEQSDWLAFMNVTPMQLRSQLQDDNTLRQPYKTLAGLAPIGFDKASSSTLVTPISSLSLRPASDGHAAVRTRINQVLAEPPQPDPNKMVWAGIDDTWAAKAARLDDDTLYVILRGKFFLFIKKNKKHKNYENTLSKSLLIRTSK